jgi:hypothetical protein
MTRVFLLLVGFIFAAYGLACALEPALPARLAGLAIINGDGFAELSAMYGGLQGRCGPVPVAGGLSGHRCRPPP